MQAQALSAKAKTASGCNLAYTATADSTATKLADSTAVETLSADGEVAVEAAEVKSDAVAAEVKLFTAGDDFNAAGNAAAGAKANDTEAAAAETKCKGIQIADVLNVEGVSPTAWQPVRDMNSAKVGVAVSATVTVNVNADTQNVDGVKSAEVGADGEVAVDAVEVSSVTVTFNATVVKDNVQTEARDHAAAAEANFETDADAVDHAVYGSLDNAEAELRAETFLCQSDNCLWG